MALTTPYRADQVVPHVRQALQQRLDEAQEAGIELEQIVLDPGFGFGIIADQNYSLLAGLDGLGGLGRPLLAGVSRKGFQVEPWRGYTGESMFQRIERKRLSGSGHRYHPGRSAPGKGSRRASEPGGGGNADAILAAFFDLRRNRSLSPLLAR